MPVIKYCLITILLFYFGCSASNPENNQFTNSYFDKYSVKISQEDFEKLFAHNCGNAVYGEFGTLVPFGPSRVDEFIKAEFENIRYNYRDSLVYIKGIAKINNSPLTEGQILIGKLPADCTGKINIICIYLLQDNGKFEVNISAKDSLQIIFAYRELYNKDGECMFSLAHIDAYDIYKLAYMYKKNSEN
jgi:hypothetical protein